MLASRRNAKTSPPWVKGVMSPLNLAVDSHDDLHWIIEQLYVNTVINLMRYKIGGNGTTGEEEFP